MEVVKIYFNCHGISWHLANFSNSSDSSYPFNLENLSSYYSTYSTCPRSCRSLVLVYYAFGTTCAATKTPTITTPYLSRTSSLHINLLISPIITGHITHHGQ